MQSEAKSKGCPLGISSKIMQSEAKCQGGTLWNFIQNHQICTIAKIKTPIARGNPQVFFYRLA